MYSGNECLNLEPYASTEMNRLRFNLEDRGAWDFQVCAEMQLPISSNGDLLWKWTYSEESLTSYCQEKWNVTPDFRRIPSIFGEYNATRSFKQVSNIIFSNG